jgi:competence protein ComEA
MTLETPDLTKLAARLEMIVDRLDKLEVQVRGLVTSQTVEAKAFVVKDDRAVIRARLEMAQYAPCLTFYDPAGKERLRRLRIGLRTDSSPMVRVAQREIPLG